MEKKKRTGLDLAIATLWVWAALFGICYFNHEILMTLPLGWRMIVMPLMYLFIALVPAILALTHGNSWEDFGFSKDKLGKQIIWGIGLAVAMTVVLTLPFYFFGMPEMVDNGKHYERVWQFAYEFVYDIFIVGLVEEFVFRGFFFQRFSQKFRSTVIPIVASSLLFGLFHIFSGNWMQILSTAIIGMLLCLAREKGKHCSTLSLIVAHGIYGAMICVWLAVLT